MKCNGGSPGLFLPVITFNISNMTIADFLVCLEKARKYFNRVLEIELLKHAARM